MTVPTDDKNPEISIFGGGVIQVVYLASYGFGEEQVSLGQYEYEEDAQNAILAREASEHPGKLTCHNCNGTGILDDEECNMCSGTGKIAP